MLPVWRAGWKDGGRRRRRRGPPHEPWVGRDRSRQAAEEQGDGGAAVLRLVDRVIGHAAEGVERACRRAHTRSGNSRDAMKKVLEPSRIIWRQAAMSAGVTYHRIRRNGLHRERPCRGYELTR